MKVAIHNFLCRDDAGAVTVDWVVLTAAIVGLGIAVMIPIGYGTDSLSQDVGSYIGASPIGVASNN